MRVSIVFFFFFKQKTAYEMRISDWSSDVCSSDLSDDGAVSRAQGRGRGLPAVLPDGGFLRTVFRRRARRGRVPRYRAHVARRACRRKNPEVRRARARGGKLSRAADKGREPRRGRRPEHNASLGEEGGRSERT